MAQTMCPLCGVKTHVNTGDPVGYEKRYPELMLVGYACQLCSDCTPELIEGDTVFVRSLQSDAGSVVRVAVCANGYKLYRVQLTSGATYTYPRNMLTINKGST